MRASRPADGAQSLAITQQFLPTAFAFIIGGAIGNVVDRLMHGAVVDFLYFYVEQFGWPAFNLADSAIFVGVALMLWAQFRSPKQDINSNPERSS